MELNEYISGERLQEIADVTFIGTYNCNMSKQLVNTKTKILENNQFRLEANENIVFVYGHDLDLFFNQYFPKIDKPIKIISHNTDEPITSRFKQFLESPKLIHWWGQNAVYNHSKLTPIPIGIANSQWPHGNKALLKAQIEKNASKEYLVYKNFDVSTNTAIRHNINLITERNGIGKDVNRPFQDYIDIVSKTVFVISPPGNGVDCHRIWESLYLKAIPVVEKNDCFRGYEHLPILFITDWNQVTIPWLKSQVNTFNNNYNSDILTMSYWEKTIKL